MNVDFSPRSIRAGFMSGRSRKLQNSAYIMSDSKERVKTVPALVIFDIEFNIFVVFYSKYYVPFHSINIGKKSIF